MDEEILVTDITMELIGERSEERRAGFDSGLKEGTRRVLDSHALGQMAFELTLLRAAAKKLGEKADYWANRSNELELQVEHWWRTAHGLEAA